MLSFFALEALAEVRRVITTGRHLWINYQEIEMLKVVFYLVSREKRRKEEKGNGS
jgi:hypothetical protein